MLRYRGCIYFLGVLFQMNLSVFPLNAIICPQGRIALRIFEPRYLDMIRHCLRSDESFVICLYTPKSSESSLFYSVGTEVKVVDFGKMDQQGILNITVEGLSQVQLSEPSKGMDGVWQADITKIPVSDYVPISTEFDDLRLVLKALIKHPFVDALDMTIDFDDAQQVGWRLTELLPLGNEQKQSLYELESSALRLSKIAEQLSTMVC